MSTTDVRQSGAEDPPQQEADGTQTTTSATGEEHETGGGQSEMGPGPTGS